MKKTALVAAALVLVGVVAITAWLTLGDQETTARGTCGSATTYELAVENEDDALELTFELQSSGPGETWDIVVEQDGTTLLEGQRQTDEDAEVDVDVVAQEDNGDQFTVTATPAEGEACTAQVTRG